MTSSPPPDSPSSSHPSSISSTSQFPHQPQPQPTSPSKSPPSKSHTSPSRLPPKIHGISLTPSAQCVHWHSALDIISIKHACCHKFYACISCHDELEEHESATWGLEQRGERAVFCGACKGVLLVEEYLRCGSRCPFCGAGFNPGCKKHWELYFEVCEEDFTDDKRVGPGDGDA